jgi:hypothetical protein
VKAVVDGDIDDGNLLTRVVPSESDRWGERWQNGKEVLNGENEDAGDEDAEALNDSCERGCNAGVEGEPPASLSSASSACCRWRNRGGGEIAEKS